MNVFGFLSALVDRGPMQSFACAAFGSVAVEFVFALRTHESGNKFPARYRRSSFWVVRSGVAVISGIAAIILEANNPVLAMQVGITIPSYFTAAARHPLP